MTRLVATWLRPRRRAPLTGGRPGPALQRPERPVVLTVAIKLRSRIRRAGAPSPAYIAAPPEPSVPSLLVLFSAAAADCKGNETFLSSVSPRIQFWTRETNSSDSVAMAEPNPEPHQQVEEREVVVQEQEQEPAKAKAPPKLRHLDFVRVAAAQAAVCLAGLYGLAKDHAGPLRFGVDAVESAVRGVVGPVYGRFHHVPLDVLAFVDRKVDDTVHELDKHLPQTVKTVTSHACAVARGVPEVARELTAEAQQSGVKGAARAALAKVEPVAKDVYARYEPAAEHLAVSTWRSFNRLPVFPHVAQVVVPTAAYWANKYNQVVASAAEKGYAGAKYLPAVPTERIAKVFAEEKGAAKAQ